jgi:hypothetical protein
MINKESYAVLAVRANDLAHQIRRAHRDVNDAIGTPRLASVVHFHKKNLAHKAQSIRNAANRLGLKVHRYRSDTPEYFATIANMARAKAAR